MNGTILRLVAVGLVVSLVAGCGFQLRGGRVLPQEVSDVYLDAPRLLGNELRILLESSDTRIAKVREQSQAVLSVHDELFDRRVLSVDPNTGKEREFEIIYRVSFGVTRTAGGILVEPQQVRLERDYVFDGDAIIGKSREEGVLREEMLRDAAQQIVRRIRAALRS